MKRQLITLIDSVGRYIVGEFHNETETTLSLKTPIILNIQPDPNSGKLHIENFPLFFKEFLAPESTNIWTYAKSAVVQASVQLDDRLVKQYESMAYPAAVKAPSQPGNNPVVKLFDK